jgi:LCP family protein required for cell wall assembly
MVTASRRTRTNRNREQNQINLVSARSRSAHDANKLSRLNSADGYAQLRKKRAQKKRILQGAIVAISSLLVASLVAVAAYALIVNGKLGTDLQGNKADFDSGVYQGVFVPPEPEAPFWILLMGTDDDNGGSEIPRTDTLILARVDQASKTAALISIPRDLYVNIPGYGSNKINAAYVFAEMDEPGSGPAVTVKTISELAGIDIAYFAQISFSGLTKLVDDLGGVEVDVPVDIIGDMDAGGLDIYAGLQKLDGAHALTFCRSREFEVGDYQRQANQRTFLQALARQVLASDLPTIATTLTNMADMTFTNMDIPKLVGVAQGMQGMQENSIYTYHLPSAPSPELINGVSYVVADDYSWRQLIEAIDAGIYPEHQDNSYAGIIPESYVAGTAKTLSDQLEGQTSEVDASDYVVDVRNGYGVPGVATSISDMLVLAGYQRGEVGNMNSYVYETTLVVYRDESDKAVAEDIRHRLGFGKSVPAQSHYIFDGDILVVVGGEFPQTN